MFSGVMGWSVTRKLRLCTDCDLSLSPSKHPRPSTPAREEFYRESSEAENPSKTNEERIRSSQVQESRKLH